jgi:hypothetical protein
MNEHKQNVLTIGLLSVVVSIFLSVAAVQAQDKNDDKSQIGGPEDKREWHTTGKRGGRGRQWINRLKEENPEKFEELKALHQQDPQAFRNELRKMAKQRFGNGRGGRGGKGGGGRPPRGGKGELRDEAQALRQLVVAYHQSSDDGEKERLEGEIRAAVATFFDKRIEKHEQHLERMQERLAELSDKLDEKRNNRDQVIEDKVEKLLTAPEERSGWGEQGGRRRGKGRGRFHKTEDEEE